MGVNIKDVAKLAGVSTATVSRVLAKTGFVSDKLRNKVYEAIEVLNYIPNNNAKVLRSNSSKTIGFILPDICNSHFTYIYKGAEETLEENGWGIILANSNENIEKERENLKRLISYNIEGLLFIGVSWNSNIESLIKLNNIPSVFLGRKGKNEFSTVTIDNYTAMHSLSNYLKDINVKKIIYMGGPDTSSSAIERARAINESGFEETLLLKGDFSFDSGYARCSEIKDKIKNYDAIVCANDLIAFGVMNFCKDFDINIPQDILITGFDNLFISSHIYPSLTTIAHPTKEIGKVGANILLDFISKKRKEVVHLKLDHKLIIRNSTNKNFGEKYEK